MVDTTTTTDSTTSTRRASDPDWINLSLRTDIAPKVGDIVEDLDWTHQAPLYVKVDGEPQLVIERGPSRPDFVEALRRITYSKVIRAAGIRNDAQTIGFLASQGVLRRYGCRASGLHTHYPEEHSLLTSVTRRLSEMFEHLLPNRAEIQRDVMSAVHPDWHLHGGMWTSGVINRTSQLPYHYDKNNLEGGWSAMLILRRSLRGGHLHIPELDMVLRFHDGDLILFNGRDLLHGVTPFVRRRPDGYRYSIVFYPVAKMKRCLPYEEEMRRARVTATEAERTRLERQGIKP